MKTITRQDIYDLVWFKPIREVSIQLNIKATLIKGICQSHKIPVPMLGHWTKLEFNKESPVYPFIEDDQLDDTIDLTGYLTKPKVKPVIKEVEIKPIILDDKKQQLRVQLKGKELDVITETRKRLKEGYNYYRKYNEKHNVLMLMFLPNCRNVL